MRNVIEGRRVAITTYRWSVQDSPLEASGEAGPHFASVAHFYPSGPNRELYVAFVSNAPSDLKYYHQLFWTVSFPGSTTAAAGAPAAAPTAAVANVAAVAPTSTITVGRVCSSAPAPTNLPAATAVVDSAVVSSLLAGAAPIPSGYEVIRLQFDAGGELEGLGASDSNLPEASQKELAAIVGTNLKTLDAKTPPSIYLRIDSSTTGLRYSVVPPPTC